MKCFGVWNAVFGAESAATGDDELADVISFGGDVVIGEKGQALVPFREFVAETGAEVAGRAFGAISAVGVDDLVDLLADIDDAGNFGPAGEVVFFLNRSWGVAKGDLLRKVVGAAGHPAGGLDGAGDCVVVGVFFIMGPGIPADYSVGFEGANEKDKAANDFIEGDVGHAMVVVIEVEVTLAAEDASDFGVIAFIAKDVFADGAGGAEARRVTHIVIGGADEVTGVALLNEFGDGAGGGERDVVGMSLDGEEDLALMGLASGGSFENGRSLLCEQRRGEEAREELAAAHGGIISIHGLGGRLLWILPNILPSCPLPLQVPT